MKKYLTILITIILVSFASEKAVAQFGYKNVHDTIDGVAISYKWSHSKWLNKDSPLQLRLKIKNTNEHDVKISFELAYLFNHIVKFNSGEQETEIKAGRARSGKLNGFYFQTDALTNEEIKSDKFEWDFLKFEVNKIKKK